MLFEIIFASGYIKVPVGLCLVRFRSQFRRCAVFWQADSKSWKDRAVQTSPPPYDEIIHLQEFPNFKSSRILGYCLAVLGVTVGNRRDFDRAAYAIRKVVVSWVKKYFLSLRAAQPYVAETCLLGSITLDEKTPVWSERMHDLDLEQRMDFLDLDPADPNRIGRRNPLEVKTAVPPDRARAKDGRSERHSYTTAICGKIGRWKM